MNFLIDGTFKLQEFLKIKFPDSSNRTILNWIKNGRIFINNIVIKKGSFIIKNGQNLTVQSKDKTLPQKIKVIYEDPFLLIIDKPNNLLSVPKDTPNSINVLKILRQEYNTKNIFAVHRIDRDASGLLVFAKSLESLEKLKQIFKNHDLTRKYLAIVEGVFWEDKGKWEIYLIEKRDLKVYSARENEGLKAITHFETLYRNNNYSFLSLTLETGKKHQIRVQLKEIGFPIVGDKKYGNKSDPIGRLALHAYLLKFNHPFLERTVSFTSPLPQEFYHLGADKIINLL
jgi:23S rRNA pseudouridine1911/1915/1917 synthase